MRASCSSASLDRHGSREDDVCLLHQHLFPTDHHFEAPAGLDPAHHVRVRVVQVCSAFEPFDLHRFAQQVALLQDLQVGRLELEALEGADINTAKIALANAVTTLCHGEEAAQAAETTARQSFSEGAIADGLPTLEIAEGDLGTLSLIDAFIQIGLASSKGEVRRLIRGGGARLNNQALTEEDKTFDAADFDEEGKALIAAGKKRRAVLHLSR